MNTTASEYLLSICLATIVIGMINLIYTASFSALIFKGALAGYFEVGITIILISYAVSAVVMALAGSLPGLITTPKGVLMGIVSTMAMSISAFSRGTPDEILATLLICMAISAFLSGFAFLLMGVFRLGHLIRFVPLPVISGYFVGVGYLLVKSSLSMMTGAAVCMETLATLVHPDQLLLWGPGAIFALAGWLVLRRFNHYLTLPLLTAVGIGGFYAISSIGGQSIQSLRRLGFLQTIVAGATPLPKLFHEYLSDVDWRLVVSQSGNMLSLVVVGILSILVYISLTEADADEEIDLGKDLKAAGVANMLLAVFGGAVCFHTPVDTRLSRQIGGKQRLIGFTFAAMSLSLMAGGSSLIGFFPTPIMGGLIMLIGIQVLYEHLTRSRRQLAKTEFFLVLLIAAAVIKLGVLQGIGIGIIVAAILFIVDYSRVEPVAAKFSGTFHHSKVERSRSERQYLKDHGTQTLVFILRGYLFFGSAERIFKQIQQALKMPTVDGRRHVRFVLLDFHLVNGIDASALNVFRKLTRFTKQSETNLIFAGLNHGVERQFQINGIFEIRHILKFDQFDYAMEWCENRLLKDWVRVQGVTDRQRNMGQDNLLDDKIKFTLKMYGHRIQLERNELLFNQGAPSDCLYMIESGSISILLNEPDDTSLRLRKMGPGTILGEIGLYAHKGRSAQAIAADDSLLWVLPDQRLRELEKDHPYTANDLHRFILKSLSRRISRDNEAMSENGMWFRPGALVS